MIEFEGGAFSCTARNLSDVGAAVDVPTCIGIPPEFNLFVERVVRHSRIVCRKVARIGVWVRRPGDWLVGFEMSLPSTTSCQEMINC